MPEFLGPIEIPDPPVIDPFPLSTDYGGGMDYEPPIAMHTFDQPGLKTEQRFVLGSGARRFRIRRNHLSCDEYDRLKAHWLQAQGVYAQFPYTHFGPVHNEPTDTYALGPIAYTARYEQPQLTFDHLVGLITGDPGVTLLEVPTVVPEYTVGATLTRFPDEVFAEALSAQAQHLIPLITIVPRTPPAPPPPEPVPDPPVPMYLSNQRFTLDGVLYLPRLLEWAGISQTLGESADSARFTFGNADDVFTQLGNQVNLARAVVRFALYHVESQTRINLWSGYARPWVFDTDGHFELGASDGAFEMGLGYPTRVITRACWKVYKGRYCPSVSSQPRCEKSYEQCVERGVETSFGGVVVPKQRIRVKDNSTGIWGWGRSSFRSVTVANDTIYQRPIQEIYTDSPTVVECDVAGGRDEDEFYAAIGIVGEGPIGGYSKDLGRHKLDGQIPHDPLKQGGFRGIVGNEPAGEMDYFAISQFPWNTVPNGATYAGGLAFAEIRRSDEAGLQLAKLTERSMQVTVTSGIGGWVWTAPGVRVWQPGLSNFVWVAINVYLRAVGLRVDPDHQGTVTIQDMEAFFDVPQAIAMAAWADQMVDRIIGTGQERQFPFRGALKERKPLRDWLQEIMNCGLGYYTFADGKLWIGIRFNSSVLEGNAYTRATILYKSLQIAPIQPRFNWLTGQFGDEEFDNQLNNVTVYDIDHAAFIGKEDSPEYLSSTVSLVGVSNKSQAARIISTRLREELGGVGKDEQRNARQLRFRTTVLGLKTMVGDIISLTHDSLPLDPESLHKAQGRVQRWTLNPDFSIDIEATPTTDAMYDLVAGPKPDDVEAEPVPPETLPSPAGLTWMPNEVAPFPGDPIFTDPLERTFALWQDYHISRDGIWDPALYVAGEMAVNRFADIVQPRIVSILLSSGGTFDGGQTIYAAVTQRDGTGQPIVPSNLSAIWIPPGLTGQRVTIQLAPAKGIWAGWDLWVGLDRRAIAWQFTAEGALPSTVHIDGPVHQMTRGLPEGAARRVRIAAKHIWHSGIAGVLVTGVTVPNQIQASDFVGSSDPWIGRFLTANADQSDGSAPLWNFAITAFDSASGTFTVTPDCVRGPASDSVEVGDVLIMRSIATAADATSVTDVMWNNSVALLQFGSPGLAPNAEIGRVVRIWRGKGAGQFRRIVGNTATKIDIEYPWEVIPDETSIIFVEAAEWVYTTESSDLAVPRAGGRIELRMRVDNLRDRVALVAGYLVDDRMRQSAEFLAPMREIYVFGQPPTVRVIGPDEGLWQALPTDHTLRADTSANQVIVQLMPLFTYEGRPLLVFNEGSNNVIINAYPGETFFDGSTSIVLTTLGESIRITAG